MSNVQRGNSREVRTAKLLEEMGWTVGSRRHIRGAGDLLAVRWLTVMAEGTDPFGDADLVLIEVKSTPSPFSHFGPKARKEMIRHAGKLKAEAWLCHWPYSQSMPRFIHQSRWPAVHNPS